MHSKFQPFRPSGLHHCRLTNIDGLFDHIQFAELIKAGIFIFNFVEQGFVFFRYVLIVAQPVNLVTNTKAASSRSTPYLSHLLVFLLRFNQDRQICIGVFP